MCELFGLSSNRPVLPGELLRRFRERGGNTADNPDGWGLAVLEDGAFRLIKEPQPAVRSARFLELSTQVHAPLILGHVRKANPPTAKILENTHPFRRSCCGREWIFAHNGLIPDTIALGSPGVASPCALSGVTDSEHAFCVVLDYIAAAFSSSETVEDHGWFYALARAAEMLASHGRFNFLMSDGVHLIAYGHDRLHSLADSRAALRLDAATETAVIATEPLTEGLGWIAFEPGELRVYRAGRRIARFITHPRAMAPAPDADLPRIKSIVSDTGRPALLNNGGLS
jgi:predicted glutamine amidotransferase